MPELPRPPIYKPTDAECRCQVCGDKMIVTWVDTVPPDPRCREGAQVVTDCPGAMNRALMRANLLKIRQRWEASNA